MCESRSTGVLSFYKIPATPPEKPGRRGPTLAKIAGQVFEVPASVKQAMGGWQQSGGEISEKLDYTPGAGVSIAGWHRLGMLALPVGRRPRRLFAKNASCPNLQWLRHPSRLSTVNLGHPAKKRIHGHPLRNLTMPPERRDQRGEVRGHSTYLFDQVCLSGAVLVIWTESTWAAKTKLPSLGKSCLRPWPRFSTWSTKPPRDACDVRGGDCVIGRPRELTVQGVSRQMRHPQHESPEEVPCRGGKISSTRNSRSAACSLR